MLGARILPCFNGKAPTSINSSNVNGNGLGAVSYTHLDVYKRQLQELTRLAVQSSTGSFSRVILDVAGSRDARRTQLERLVDSAVAKLDEGASQASLPSMLSYERKLVHDIVA